MLFLDGSMTLDILSECLVPFLPTPSQVSCRTVAYTSIFPSTPTALAPNFCVSSQDNCSSLQSVFSFNNNRNHFGVRATRAVTSVCFVHCCIARACESTWHRQVFSKNSTLPKHRAYNSFTHVLPFNQHLTQEAEISTLILQRTLPLSCPSRRAKNGGWMCSRISLALRPVRTPLTSPYTAEIPESWFLCLKGIVAV